MRQQELPARKNRKYGTPSDGTPSNRPKITVLIRIGMSGRANSQNLPSVVSSYRSLIRRSARNHRMRR
jgi:hypothetical protein